MFNPSPTRLICSQLSDYQCSFDDVINVDEETPKQTMGSKYLDLIARDLEGLPKFDLLQRETEKYNIWLPLSNNILHKKEKAQNHKSIIRYQGRLTYRPSILENRSLSHTILQNIQFAQFMGYQNRKSSSFHLKQKINRRPRLRRLTDYQHISSKQERLSEQYPKTIIQQHQFTSQKQLFQKKRTILKRMSSILIKHQSSIRIQFKSRKEIVQPHQLLQQIKQQELLQHQLENNNDVEYKIQTPDLLETKKNLTFLENNIFKLSGFRKHQHHTNYKQHQSQNLMAKIKKKEHRTNKSLQSYLNEKSLINAQTKDTNYTKHERCNTQNQYQSQTPVSQTKQFSFKTQPNTLQLKSQQNLPCLNMKEIIRAQVQKVYLSNQTKQNKLQQNIISK